MDLKQMMQEMHYNAQYLSDEERTFFEQQWGWLKKRGEVPQSSVSPLVDMYRKIKLRQVDVNTLILELEHSVLMLSSDEQALVEAARITFELGDQLDPATLIRLLGIRKELVVRQHQTQADSTTEAPKKQGIVVQQQPSPPKRPSARRVQPQPAHQIGNNSLKAALDLLNRKRG